MPSTDINSEEQFKQVINSGKRVIIDFHASWCGPCHAIAPKFENFSNTYPEVEFYRVDVDVQYAIAREVGITAMPTFIVFKEGKKVGELKGAVENDLETLIKKL